jgi:hypothetical protein
MPISAHSGTPIPLTLFFSSVHTLGTMYDSSLGVWETHSHTLVPFLKKKIACSCCLKFLVDLKIL